MVDEKIYTIPLRKAWRTERTRRAKKAMSLIKQFLARHTKVKDTDKVQIGKTINEAVWARSMQKPPRRVRIHAVVENGIVFSELIGTDIKTPSAKDVKAKEQKKEDKKEKIKEERKERKKMTIQEEVDESGVQPEGVTEKEAKIKQKEEKQEVKTKQVEKTAKDKETGKA